MTRTPTATSPSLFASIVRRRLDPELLGRAQQQHRIADRFRSRNQQQRRASCGSPSSRRTKLCSIRPVRRERLGTPKPSASWSGVSPRGSSSKASGFPCVSATIRSRTSTSSLNGTADRSSARASPLTKPCTSSSESAGAPRRGFARREHHADRIGLQATSNERERQRRRLDPTNGHRRRRTTAGAPPPPPTASPSTASPTTNRSGATPVLIPKTISSARRCGAGSRSSRSSSGEHS